mgnify:CR=1 FL=1
MVKNWGRLLTAMITPYDAEGNVDYDQATTLAKVLLENGSDGLVLWGTTGESPVLTLEEKELLYKHIREAFPEKPLIVATGSNNTKDTVEMTKRAGELGADGAMVVVPYYNKPSQQGLYEHFKAAAESTDIPIMIYNIPGRTGITMDVETVGKLAEIPNVKAIKESAGDVTKVTDFRKVTPDDFVIYSGDDILTLPMLANGAYGVVSVASHIAAKPLSEMIELFVSGNIQEALHLHEQLTPLFKGLFYDSNPVPVKLMLDDLGFQTGGVRLPLVKSDEVLAKKILHVLRQYDEDFLNRFSRSEVKA